MRVEVVALSRVRPRASAGFGASEAPGVCIAAPAEQLVQPRLRGALDQADRRPSRSLARDRQYVLLRPDRRENAAGQGPLRGRVSRMRRLHPAAQWQGRRLGVRQGAVASRRDSATLDAGTSDLGDGGVAQPSRADGRRPTTGRAPTPAAAASTRCGAEPASSWCGVRKLGRRSSGRRGRGPAATDARVRLTMVPNEVTDVRVPATSCACRCAVTRSNWRYRSTMACLCQSRDGGTPS